MLVVARPTCQETFGANRRHLPVIVFKVLRALLAGLVPVRESGQIGHDS